MSGDHFLPVSKQWIALEGLGGPRLSLEFGMPSEPSSQECCGEAMPTGNDVTVF